MSMDDAHEAAARRLNWPVSLVNTVLIAVCAVGALVCFVVGATIPGVALLLGALGGALGAVFARRGTSGDLERVNALEYADERDRAAGAKGLAAVGVLALVLSAVQLIVIVVMQADSLARYLAGGQFVLLMLGWLAANWFFVRRG